MGDYKKAGKKKVEGKKTPVVVYKKAGSSKLYVMRKGRMMSYVNYKKMCAKKLMAKVAKKVSKVRKVRKNTQVRKVRKGGEGCGNHEEFSQPNVMDKLEFMTDNSEPKNIMGGGQQQRRQQQRRQQQRRQQQGGEELQHMLGDEGVTNGLYQEKNY